MPMNLSARTRRHPPPRHAAPVRLVRLLRGWAYPTRFGSRAHRALRLFVAVGTGGAGLCLVIGSIVVVATAAGSGRLAPNRAPPASRLPSALARAGPAARQSRETATSGGVPVGAAASDTVQIPPSPSPTPSHQPPAWRRPHARADFTGQGDETTASFSVGRGSSFELAWSYTCPAGSSSGQFKVVAFSGTPGKAAAGTPIVATGVSGHGTTWLRPAGPTYYLVVTSTCSWVVQVIQPARTS